jgi:CubicO group peptidase (beta-lactamase class C family)
MNRIEIGKLQENIDLRIQNDIASGRLSASGVFVFQDGQTLLEKYYGFENTEKKKPLNEKSIFRLASMTKPVTAVAVLREIEKGRLNLFDPVEKFLPAYSDMDIAEVRDGSVKIVRKAVNKVRILNLLTHTSGIGSGTVGELTGQQMTEEDNIDLTSAVKFYANQPLAFEPYTESQYSPIAAFDILAHIVELVSGKSFEQYLKDEIFNPLGMTDTTFQPDEEQKSRIVEMYSFDNGIPGIRMMKENCIFENIPVTHFSGGAGLVSTVKDYSRFARMLLQGGIFEGQRILEEKTVAAFSIPHIPEVFVSERWTLGMRVITNKNYKRLPVSSFGWSGAYGTHFWVDPVNRLTAIYMKNSAYDGGSGALTAAHMEEDVARSFSD